VHLVVIVAVGAVTVLCGGGGCGRRRRCGRLVGDEQRAVAGGVRVVAVADGQVVVMALVLVALVRAGAGALLVQQRRRLHAVGRLQQERRGAAVGALAPLLGGAR